MNKLKLTGFIIILLLIAGLFLYFKYFFTYEQKNIAKRKIESITGQNLTVTVIGIDGRVIKRWDKVQKITSGEIDKSYTYFYTKDNKYVQIPDSVWYIAEEE
jgi:hypothetical protein